MLSPYLEAWQIRELVEKKEVKPREIAEFFIRRVEQLNPDLGAFITITAERALADAARLENARAREIAKMPLYGVPYSIKDLTWTRDIRTTMGSKNYEHFMPAQVCRSGCKSWGGRTTRAGSSRLRPNGNRRAHGRINIRRSSDQRHAQILTLPFGLGEPRIASRGEGEVAARCLHPLCPLAQKRIGEEPHRAIDSRAARWFCRRNRLALFELQLARLRARISLAVGGDRHEENHVGD